MSKDGAKKNLLFNNWSRESRLNGILVLDPISRFSLGEIDLKNFLQNRMIVVLSKYLRYFSIVQASKIVVDDLIGIHTLTKKKKKKKRKIKKEK